MALATGVAYHFLVSLSFHDPNAEEDDRKVLAFLAKMESAIRDHLL